MSGICHMWSFSFHIPFLCFVYSKLTYKISYDIQILDLVACGNENMSSSLWLVEELTSPWVSHWPHFITGDSSIICVACLIMHSSKCPAKSHLACIRNLGRSTFVRRGLCVLSALWQEGASVNRANIYMGVGALASATPRNKDLS